MNIIGWHGIVPQLAVFFAVLKRRPNCLTPYNVFLSGLPGTNKSEGAMELSQLAGLDSAIVDTSTIDDVAELAGIIDLNANRNHSESRLIEGQALKKPVLILDEFPNARAHVVPQFRLFLQGRLTLFGNDQLMNTTAIIATGNLSDEMQQGEANVLDSPTADRFVMVIQVPSLAQMTGDDATAILEGDDSVVFGEAFKKAVGDIHNGFEEIEKQYGRQVTSYVRSLVTQLTGTPFAFEARRGKLVRLFVLAALALCEAQPERDREETVWQVTRDALSYHRLSGLPLDMLALRTAVKVAWKAMSDSTAETEIASEPDVAIKVGLMVKNLDKVSPMTKAAVFSKVVGSDDTVLKLATFELVRTERFRNEPAELAAFTQRIRFDDCKMHPSIEQVRLLARMSPTQGYIYQLCAGDDQEIKRLTGQVRKQLEAWGVESTTL